MANPLFSLPITSVTLTILQRYVAHVTHAIKYGKCVYQRLYSTTEKVGLFVVAQRNSRTPDFRWMYTAML